MSASWYEPRRPRPATRPATRLGRYLLFPGGNVVRLSRREHLLYALGLRTTYLSTPHQKENV